MKKMLASALLVSGLALAAPAGAATVFFNDFEDTDFGSGAGYTILPSYAGWTTVAGPGIEVQYNNVAGQAFSGENLIELDSTGNSAMGRTIEAGTYLLSFYYSDRPGVGAASNGIRVTVDGLPSLYVIDGGQGGGQTNWVLHTFSFTSAGGELRFAADGVNDSLGGYLDNVRLQAVPEPGAWAMLIAGFGVVGAAMRRRHGVRAIAQAV